MNDKNYVLNKTKYNRLEISKILNVEQQTIRRLTYIYNNYIPPVRHNTVPYYSKNQIELLEKVIKLERVGKSEKEIIEFLKCELIGNIGIDINTKLTNWVKEGLITQRQMNDILNFECRNNIIK